MKVETLVDISKIVARKQSWENQKRISVLREYENFLKTCADGHGGSTPTKDIDLLWHEHILNTRMYIEYTKSNFGKFIHHVPSYTEYENSSTAIRTSADCADSDSGCHSIADCGHTDAPCRASISSISQNAPVVLNLEKPNLQN